MAYPNTPKVAATYVDGSFKQTTFSSQPKIIILGSATSGRTDEIYEVANTGGAETEFGSNTELCKALHETVASGADNVSLMRIGGRSGSWVATDSSGGTLTITPLYRDDTIFDRYSLFITTLSGGVNRYLVYDLIDQTWVFDSAEILTINEGIIDVDDSNFDVFTVGDISAPDIATSLTDLEVADFTAGGSSTLSTLALTTGSDGTSISLVEKYAALNRAYHNLDFRDGDFVIPKGVYIDDNNIADGDSCNFFKGVPVAGDSNDTLGYVWQYEYQGTLYTYFVDQADYFSESKAAATVTVNTDLVITAAKNGTGGNSIQIQLTQSGSGSAVISTAISEPTVTSLLIHVTAGSATTNSTIRTAINSALAAYTMRNGALASTIVSSPSAGSTVLSGSVSATSLSGGLGGHVLTHQDLTGDAIPSAVSSKFSAALTDDLDSQLREVNFAHQLATYCHIASTTWKAIQGGISVKEPTSLSRLDIASWVGSPPIITEIGIDEGIDAPSDNGSGLFSIKLMTGKSETSNGYRNHMLESGNTTDGYLYGGLILTKGLGLPNADSDLAYGIEDGDEAVDENGKPIDLGRYIYVTIDWPIHSNAFASGTLYRGSIECSLIGLLARIPENEEPIGRSYALSGIRGVPRIHSSQRDALSKFRFVNLRFEDGVGWVFNSVKTAAHPIDSDYSRCSTMRSVNRILGGIRNIAREYIGKAFDSLRLAALQSDVDGYLVGQRGQGFINSGLAKISYTRNDKILGKLTIRIRMVPPFTIQEINEIVSLAAEEAEL